jgi:hypothetical protein
MKRAWYVVVSGWVGMAALAAPATPVKPAASDGIAACEKAAQDALRDTRGTVDELAFAGTPSRQPGAGDQDEFTLKGSGRYRVKAGTARAFSYSCTYNTRTSVVAGVVLRDAMAGDASAPRPAAPAKAVEPDLSRVSPEACESAAALALRKRNPRVEHISFNSELRQLQQDALGRGHLQGQGTAVRMPGDPSTHFTYMCDFDPRTGRVLAVQTTD